MAKGKKNAAPRGAASEAGNVVTFRPREPKSRLDVRVNPYEFTVADLRQLLARYDGDLAVRIGHIDEDGNFENDDQFELTRIAPFMVTDEFRDERGKKTTADVACLMFIFDASVEVDEFDGPHDDGEKDTAAA